MSTNPSIDQTLVERVKAALEPFAEIAVNFVGEEEDDLDYYRPHYTDRQKLITVGWLRRAADAYEALLASTPAVQGEAIPAAERAWLVERTDTDRPTWYAQMHMNPRHYSCWTTDANKAMRFCREQDAQEMVLVLNSITPTNAIATEHAWIAYTPRTLPTTPADVAAVREQIARIAYPGAFDEHTERYLKHRNVMVRASAQDRRARAFAKADEILRALPLFPATDGMVLVPREPTEAMLGAASANRIAWDRIRANWTAMLAAVETDHG